MWHMQFVKGVEFERVDVVRIGTTQADQFRRFVHHDRPSASCSQREDLHARVMAARRSAVGLSPAAIDRFLAEAVELDLHAKTYAR